MVNIANFLINASVLSALYAIIAIGFTLIFGVGGILNFAHGSLILIGGYSAYLISNSLGTSPWIGLVVGVITAALFAGALYMGIIRRIEDRPLVVLLVTVLIGFLVRNITRVVHGTGSFSIPLIFTGSSSIAGIQLQHYRVAIFTISWLCILALFYLVNRTTLGKSIIATSMSEKGAALVGIKSDRVNLYTWTIAGAFAGLAGVLVTGFQTGGWQMGVTPMVLSFSIVILGGLGSIKGSIVGAYAIGFLETATTSFISTRLSGVAALILLIGVLLFKPSGLFGREVAQ